MKYSSLTERIVDPGTEAWDIHYRAAAMKLSDGDVILLSVGQEGDIATPKPIVDACVGSLHAGNHHYSAVEGSAELRKAIASYHTDLTGQVVNADNCTFYSGAQNALFAIAQCLLEPGDHVLLSEPYYTTYPTTFASSGAKVSAVPVRAEDNYVINPDNLLAAIEPDTRAIVLNSPSNPLGAVYQRQQLEPVFEYCRDNGIWLISDEVYTALLPRDERFSVAQLDTEQQCCITISSVSKSHRMTGWRCGWVVAPLDLTSHLWNLSLCMHYGLPAFLMDATIEALKHDEISTAVRAALSARRRIVNNHLKLPDDLTLFDSGLGMFILINVEKSGLTAFEFAEQLLAHRKVAVLPCDGFGESSRYLLRIGLCVDDDQLREACHRISAFSAELVDHLPD